jgi:hypothetical protein
MEQHLSSYTGTYEQFAASLLLMVFPAVLASLLLASPDVPLLLLAALILL